MKNEKWFLLILAAVNFTHIVDFMIMMPLGPQLMRLFQISPQQFGFLVSAYTLSAGLSGFAGAFWIDRFDRKQALVYVYFGFLSGTTACALAPSYSLLLTARILTGAFGGILGAIVLSLVGDAIPEERRAAAMGIVMAAFSAASVLGIPLGLYLATLWSWHAPFLGLALFGLPVLYLCANYVPSMKGHVSSVEPHRSPLKVVSSLTRNRNQLFALSFMILLVLGQFTVVPYISPYMVSNVGFSEHQLTYIYLLGGALTIFTSPRIGRWADRIGKPRVFMLFALLTVIPLFLITNMPKLALPLALVVTTLFFVCSSGRWIPAVAMITATVEPKNRGSFMSINSSVQQLAAAFGATLSGLIIIQDKNGQLLHYQYVGYIAIAATLIAILLSGRLRTVS